MIGQNPDFEKNLSAVNLAVLMSYATSSFEPTSRVLHIFQQGIFSV